MVFQSSLVAEGDPGCAELLRCSNFHQCAFHVSDSASPDAANHGATDNGALCCARAGLGDEWTLDMLFVKGVIWR